MNSDVHLTASSLSRGIGRFLGVETGVVSTTIDHGSGQLTPDADSRAMRTNMVHATELVPTSRGWATICVVYAIFAGQCLCQAVVSLMWLVTFKVCEGRRAVKGHVLISCSSAPMHMHVTPSPHTTILWRI